MLDSILTFLSFATLFVVMLWALSFFLRILFLDDPMLELQEKRRAERRDERDFD